MALSDAILVCLTDGPATGYDLAKRFDTSIGFFWKAEHQQIYRELASLREKRLVDSREVVQSGKPNKLVYTLTPAGREALQAWARRPSKPSVRKDELLLKFYALEDIDIGPLRADVMTRMEHHAARLTRFERIMEKRFAELPTDRAELGKLLGLRMGLRYERAVVEWCEDALETLAKLEAAETVVSFEKEARPNNVRSGSARTKPR